MMPAVAFYGGGSMCGKTGRRMRWWAAAVLAGAAGMAAGVRTWGLDDEKAGAADGEAISLPAAQTSGGMPLTEAMAKRRSIREMEARPLSPEQVSQLCWAAQGITQAEKGFRTAPSAMHLYPLTVYVADSRAVYEYLPKPHALRRLDGVTVEEFKKAAGQSPVAGAPACLILAIDAEHLRPRAGDKAEQYALL
jgi:hypothetical protein